MYLQNIQILNHTLMAFTYGEGKLSEGAADGSSGSFDFNLRVAYYFNFISWGQKYTWESLTDMSDVGRVEFAQPIKSGNIASEIYKYSYNGAYRPILASMFIVIRKCNTVLQNIGLLKDVKQEDIDDFIAQAHFARAFAHFELLRIWGGMPYITKVIGPDDQWDIPPAYRGTKRLCALLPIWIQQLYFLKRPVSCAEISDQAKSGT